LGIEKKFKLIKKELWMIELSMPSILQAILRMSNEHHTPNLSNDFGNEYELVMWINFAMLLIMLFSDTA